MTRTKNYRPAFTLIELLVATGIIAMLLGLVAISFPRFNEREQLTRSVDKLRAGLLTARLWAKRDQVVTGLKFLPAGGPYASFVYVQQPLGNITGTVSGAVSVSGPFPNPSAGMPQLYTVKVPISNTNQISDGDYIVIDGDVPHVIKTPISNPIQFDTTSNNFNIVNGLNYRIIRVAQQIPMQEETVLTPDTGPSIAFGLLDPNTLTSIALNNDTILFLPTGTVVNAGQGTMILRVNQTLPDAVTTTEEADIFLDCLSGTNRYISPN